jgi:hypothetical protein
MTINRTEILERLLTSPMGQKIEQDIAIERAAERRQLAEDLAGLQAEQLKELKRLGAIRDAATEKRKTAEAALKTATDTERAAANDVRRSSFGFDQRAAAMRRRLQELAAPLIAETVAQLRDEPHRLHKEIASWGTGRWITGVGQERVSNWPSIQARAEAAREAIPEVEALVDLGLDDQAAAKRIDAIIARLPAVQRPPANAELVAAE